MRILVVEDEVKTGAYLKQGLVEAGFVVNLASNGVNGLHLALSGTFDLAVLDVMLPGIDGWQVLEGIRRSGQETPVLFLTARDRVNDRVKGLELGADDYLVKPFAFAELLARVRTLLRRGGKAQEASVLRAADLELDLLRRRVSRAGKRIDLTAKEFALLELLLRRQGEILPRSLIASQVWDMNFDSDTNVIEVAIRRLRAKVDDDFEPRLIRTVRGMGYVLEVECEASRRHGRAMKARASITLRLTLLFAAASTAVLLLLGYLIGGEVERHFVEQDMEVLTGKLELARHALEKVRSPGDLVAIPGLLDDSLVGHRGLAVAVVAPTGETLFATRDAHFPEILLASKALADPQRPIVWRSADAVPFRGIAAKVASGIPGAPPAIVAVATDISHHEQFMASFRRTLWRFVVGAAFACGLLGWVAVRRGLAPLQTLRQKAEGITAQRLDARLDVEAVPRELVALADSLNAMLSRLEGSFRRLSDFSSDLAHEFRTPISNLMTQTQVTLSKARSHDEYRDILASNVEEFERLSQMVADMLFIAKADEGQIVPCKKTIALATLVNELVEFYRLATDEKGVSLSSSGSAEIEGDPLMLRRALSNLIANAVGHTPAGGRIAVMIERADAATVGIAVENTGETIAAQHLPRLFDRFYRVDASRHRASEGAGLGLAITRSIVEAHGGTVAVRSGDGVTVFELSLPV